MFDKIAPKYDFLNHFLSLNRDRGWRRKAAALLPSGENNRILDLCAGTLDMSNEFVSQGKKGTVHASDFSMNMLLLGKEKLNGSCGNIVLDCSDSMVLPYRDCVFDGAMCAFGIRNLPDPEKGLSEIGRVLKKNAVLVVLDFFKPSSVSMRMFNAVYEKTVIPLVGGLVSRDRKAYRYLPESRNRFTKSGEFIELINKCGFNSVTEQACSLGIVSIISAVKQ